MDIQLESAERLPWYDVWIEVTTSPSRDTFRRILADPSSSPVRVYLWLGVLGVIIWALQVLLLQVTGSEQMASINRLGPAFLLCGGIAAPVASVIGFMIGTAILHFIAGLLGGSGSYDDLAYSLGAIQAPLVLFSSLISMISTLLAEINGLNLLVLVIAPVSLAISIYALVLEVMAISVAEKLSTGKAILTVLVPVIIALALAGCLVAFSLSTITGLLNQ